MLLFVDCTNVCFAVKVTKCLEDVGLSAERNILSKKLSGGQKRKLSLAMAIIAEPRVRKLTVFIMKFVTENQVDFFE